jgi:transcriptional regulator with XRE-family HTH domain
MSGWFEESSFAEDLGKVLTQWRLILGLSQRLVAERAGISVQVLRRLEHGEGNPQLGACLAVMDVLGLRRHTLQALDPLNTDLGRARAGLLDRQRAPKART